MNLAILCSSKDSASLDSRLTNSNIISAVSMKDYTFVMASGNTGTMRDAKEIIRENGGHLLLVGNKFELARSDADIKVDVSSTFERTQKIYENSDAILFLDGGVGLRSEFYSFLTNKMETKDNKPLIVYNGEGLFNSLFNDLEFCKRYGFVDNNYKLYFDVVHNLDELAVSLQKIEQFGKKGKVR